MKTLKQRIQRAIVAAAAWRTWSLNKEHRTHTSLAGVVVDRNESVAIRKALWASKVHRKSPKHVAAVLKSTTRYW